MDRSSTAGVSLEVRGGVSSKRVLEFRLQAGSYALKPTEVGTPNETARFPAFTGTLTDLEVYPLY